MCASGPRKCRWLVPDDEIQIPDESEPTLLHLAVQHLEEAGRIDNEHRQVDALTGIGYALLSNGEDAQLFYSLFAGPDGKANIEAWVESG